MEWTDGRYRAFIVGVLRSGMRRYPPKFECLNEAKQGRKINPRSGRLAEHYLCNGCKESFPKADVQCDHVLPVVPASGFTTWDEYIDRMFCKVDNLQVLCSTCHKIKTKSERKKKETI